MYKARPIEDCYAILDLGYKTPCWFWLGCRGKDGYGKINRNKKCQSAHKYIYEFMTGIKPKPGLELDHLCGNISCVNPEHLEQVSHRKNCHRKSINFRIKGEI